MLITILSGWTEEFRLESIGARGGSSIENEHYEFEQVEGFTDWHLPWRWELGKGWSLRPRADGSGGYLAQHHKDCFIATAGPQLVFERKELPLFLAGGMSATFIGRTAFDTKDFGTQLQFTGNIGLFWEPIRHLLLGYRWQHMSNASFARHNPGLNLHMLVVAYQF